MESLEVAEISIDADGRLLIRPREAARSFEYVYRAGAEVTWDEARSSFACPTPREWPYSRWFQQARDAVRGELGLEFKITSHTAWTNVTDAVREDICSVPVAG
jgi:hypothetical protein